MKENPKEYKMRNMLPSKEIEYDKNQLQQLILDLTEENVRAKFSDENLDRENEKLQLLGGKEINLDDIKNNLEHLISKHVSEYSKRFPQEFYDEIYRLNGWPIPKNKTVRKYIVGRYTNEIIYMRFTKKGLMKLQSLNPYVGSGFRKFKHFQLLSHDGKMMLDQIIYEAIACMKECTTWYEFRITYGKRYKLNVQLQLFEEQTIIQ